MTCVLSLAEPPAPLSCRGLLCTGPRSPWAASCFSNGTWRISTPQNTPGGCHGNGEWPQLLKVTESGSPSCPDPKGEVSRKLHHHRADAIIPTRISSRCQGTVIQG